jgi:hypothetical protein
MEILHLMAFVPDKSPLEHQNDRSVMATSNLPEMTAPSIVQAYPLVSTTDWLRPSKALEVDQSHLQNKCWFQYQSYPWVESSSDCELLAELDGLVDGVLGHTSVGADAVEVRTAVEVRSVAPTGLDAMRVDTCEGIASYPWFARTKESQASPDTLLDLFG